MNKTKLHYAVVAALTAVPVVADEQQVNKAQIETIEVTATKRTQSIQEVPVSVSALNGEALEKLGMDNFQDYVEFLPNVVFQGTGPGQNEIYIRGAATTQSNIALSSVQALQPSVALYLDEQPISMAGRNLDVFATDLDRVEVLPGPQGTLFGASSQSGTVRLITKKPVMGEFSGGFDIDIGTTKDGEMSNTVEAFVNMPLSDNLAARIAVYNDQQGGWIDNILNVPGEGGYAGSAIVIDRISGGVLSDPANTPVEAPDNSLLVEDDFNDASYSGGRFSLAWEPSDDWSVLIQHTAQTLETEGVFAYDPNLAGEQSTNRFIPDENTDEFGLTTWTVEGRLKQLELVYTGGYLNRDIDTTIDYTGYTNGGLFAAYYVCNHYQAATPADERCLDPTKWYKEDTEVTRTTHEFRMNTDASKAWRLTAGIFIDENETSTVGRFKLGNTDLPFFSDLARTTVGQEGINSDGGPFESEVSFVNDVTHIVDQLAVFGQVEYDITDTITATFGMRWYDIEDIYRGSTTTVDVTRRIRAFGTLDPDELEAVGEDPEAVQAAIDSGQLDVSLLDEDGTLSVDDTIIKASLDWQPNKDLLFFVTYSEGFRPPVTNRVGGGLATNQIGAFEGFRIPVYSLTDELDNFELGMKGDFLDSTLRINATAFYSEITDLQTSRFDPSNISFLVFTDNVGDAEITGIDADISWLATPNLVITSAFSILDTELTRINSELQGIAPGVGAELPYSAEFSGNLAATYYHDLPSGLTAFVTGSISYTGDRLTGMVMDAYAMEDATRLIYGTGSGLKIQDEAALFEGVTFNDVEGNSFRGGRYVADAYTIANLSVGVSNEEWKAEFYINNLFDERAILNVETQQFTPKVVTNRPRTMGVRFSYDFY